MKNTITMEQIVEAQHIMSEVISLIFQYEKDFINLVLYRNGWNKDECHIERCHAAALFRITLQHDDMREKDIYIEAYDVHNWVDSLGIIK